MDRLQGSLVQAAIKRLVKEFKSKVHAPFCFFALSLDFLVAFLFDCLLVYLGSIYLVLR